MLDVTLIGLTIKARVRAGRQVLDEPTTPLDVARGAVSNVERRDD